MRPFLLILAVATAALPCVMCSSFDAATTESGVEDAGPAVDGGSDAPSLEAALDSPAPSACPTGTSADGLVGFYPLDEVSGKIVHDCSPRMNDGFFVGTTPTWESGRNAGGLRVSASAGYVQLGDPSIWNFAGAFSVALWVKAASFPATGVAAYLIGKTRDPDVAGWRLSASNGGGVTAALAGPNPDGSNPQRITVSTAISENTWVHVALVVMPGADMVLYTDGLERSRIAGVPSPLVHDLAANARFGVDHDGNQPFDGVIDDIHVYARALTANEINTLRQ
jgi:hypothetical protein